MPRAAERQRAYSKLHHERNKEAIHQRKAVKLPCECGCAISSANMQRHKRTPKHEKLILNLTDAPQTTETTN